MKPIMCTSPPVIWMCLALALLGVERAGAQDAEVCGIYAAALHSILPDSTKTIVVYDSVSLATPSFAFHGWTGLGLPGEGSRVPLTNSVWESIRRTYGEGQREELPPCFGAGRSVLRVPYDSLAAPFNDREQGWEVFHRVFPNAPGFFVSGRPYFLDEARTEALLYIARATHWLSGGGTMFYLRRVGDVWEVADSHRMWVS